MTVFKLTFIPYFTDYLLHYFYISKNKTRNMTLYLEKFAQKYYS